MAISLQKGQKVELHKSNGGDLTKVIVGLGWDTVQQTKEFMFNKEAQAFDCDASAFMLQNGKMVADEDKIYFGNLSHISGTVVHMGDSMTGEGDGDDEQIVVDLEHVPAEYDKIVFVVTIFQAANRGQHIGMLQNAYIRICDDKGQEMCKYDLNDNYEGMTALVFGELYRYNGKWKFNAIGQPTKDSNVHDIANRFR